jgi:glutathione S-transferase
MHTLVLYYKPTCGYCLKVLRFLQEHNITVKLKNASENAGIRQELIDMVGHAQVPCLIHDGEILHESEDIIDWLAKNGADHDHA